MEKLKRMASAIEAYGMDDPAIGDDCQCYRVRDVDPMLEEIRNLKPGTDGFNDLIKTIKYNFQYGFHCNDLNSREMEEDICCALDRFARLNGLPEIDWEVEE